MWLSDEELKPVGCACEVEEVLERMEDGSMNILARGTRPVPAAQPPGRPPLPGRRGRVPGGDRGGARRRGRPRRARELYRDLVAQATDRELSEEELLELDAYGMAATVEFGVEAKQELLELRSENARLRLLTMLLSAAIERLDALERAQARALSNGKVRFA